MKTILYNGKQVKLTPLLMKSELVSQTLKGLKTQTRRLNGLEEINLDPDRWASGEGHKFSSESAAFYFIDKTNIDRPQKITCPYGQKGDVIWVREKWGLNYFGSIQFYHLKDKRIKPKSGDFLYEADIEEFDVLLGKKWKPSIHMPFIACRLFMEIVDIRPERLQDITQEDSIAEGIEALNMSASQEGYSPVASFCSLWMEINGIHTWETNPWVWRIVYKEIPKPESISYQ